MKEPLSVVDVSSLTGGGDCGDCAVGIVRNSSQGYSVPEFGINKFCFAGKYDDLIVSASPGNNLYVWALPDSHQENDISVTQSLLELRGHTDLVLAVRYDPCNNVLASAGVDETIKLWTPISQL